MDENNLNENNVNVSETTETVVTDVTETTNEAVTESVPEAVSETADAAEKKPRSTKSLIIAIVAAVLILAGIGVTFAGVISSKNRRRRTPATALRRSRR